MMLLSFISLVDRSILGILSPVILSDLHLSASQYGNAILVFSVCYMLANPIWGLLMDRVGLFVAIAVAVGLWSLASGAHAMLAGFLGLCIARGVLGFGEGAAFPAGLKTVTETLPAEQRSFGLGLAYSGGSLGAMLTPVFIVPLAAHWGWRSTFVLSGCVGFAWIAAWLVLRATGLYKPVIREQIATVQAIPEGSSPQRARWNRDLFATALVYGLGAAPVAYGLYSAPLYLTRVLHQPQSALAHLLWVPPAGWELGYIVWGRVADARRKRAIAAGAGVRSPLDLFILFAVGALVLCLIPVCAALPIALPLTILLYFVAMFFTGGYVVIALAHGATTQSATNTGFLAGFSISGWSLTTGILMAVVGQMFDQSAYAATFWLAASLPACGVLLWWLCSDKTQKSAHPV